MRVLWVTPWFPSSPLDGRFGFIYRSAEALLNLGVQLRIVLLRPWVPAVGRWADRVDARPPADFGPRFEFRVITAPRIPRMLALEQSYRLFRVLTDRRLRAEARQFEPDVVHAHTEWAAYSAVPVSNSMGLPVVVTLHSGDTTPQIVALAKRRGRLTRTLGAATRVAIVGRPLRAYLADFGVDGRNVSVVPNGFVLPADLQEAGGPDWTGELRLVTVSVLTRPKAVDVGLRGLASARRSGVAATYDIVGEGPERAKLERLAAELGLTQHVRFHGLLPHLEAMRMLQGAHLFLLPSYREAFGVAALEGMAAGALVVAVEGQGPADFVTHTQTGLLVPPQDAEAIGDAIRWVDSERETAAGVARAGRARAREGFTWDEHGRRLLELYSPLRDLKLA